MVHLSGEVATEIRFYPVELGGKDPRSHRGTPRLADEQTGRAIIERLKALSAPYDFDIRWETDPDLDRGVGVWRR